MVQGPVNYMVDMPNAFVEGLKGYQLSQNVMAQNQQMQAQQAMQQRRDQMSSDMAAFANRQGKTKEDYQRMMEMYPELKDQMTAAISNMNEEQKNAKVNQMMPIYAALKSGNTDAARESMKNLEDAYRSSGMDLEANNLKMLQDNLDIDPKGALASTEIFLFNADPEKFSKWSEAQTKLGKGGLERTQSSQILPDGTSIFLTSKNNIVVKNAAGEVLSGKDAINAVREAQSYGVDIAAEKAKLIEENKQIQRKEYEPQIERGKAEEKQAVTLSGQYAERLDKINENILVLDEAANRIQEGLDKGEDLGIGPIRQFLPKLSASAQDMRSIANRLGLGVVSSVTFGALSEGELKLAMSTGLPTGMKGQDLLKWIQDRKAAQQKLANYLENAAIYLGEHTLADFRKMMKEKKGQSPVQTQPIQSNQNLSNIPVAERLKMLTGQ